MSVTKRRETMSHKQSDNESENINKSEAGSAELLSSPEEFQQQLGEAQQKINQYWERILRMQADMENAARRSERDIANAHKYALEKFALALLPVIDSLELCVSNETKNGNTLIEGVNLTLKLFYGALEKFGIQQVNPQGESFNPEYQQAISMQYDPKMQAGLVISVLQKGYTLNNRLLRPALVVVSKTEEE
jgi:molecular chaperone GrpE